MKEFLLENYSWIITIVCSIISILIFLLKKVKIVKKDSAFEKVLMLLPSLIIKAEKNIKGGSDKKSFVLSMAISYLASLSGEDDEKVYQEYGKRISDAIEDILLTPVKKMEVKDEK